MHWVWHIYGFLKQVDGKTNPGELRTFFPGATEEDIEEGLAEYNTMAKDENYTIFSYSDLSYPDAGPTLEPAQREKWISMGRCE